MIAFSVLQRKILKFFLEHSHVVETAKGIATWLIEDEAAVEQDLKQLAEQKWLLTHTSEILTGYTLVQDAGRLDKMRRMLESA